MSDMPRFQPSPHRARTVRRPGAPSTVAACLLASCLLAPCLAASAVGPARAQGLESGVGHGPSDSLSVPPNETNNPDFAYGTPHRSHATPSRPRPARRPPHRPVAPSGVDRTD